jgi:hypothetical protein
MCPPLHTTLPRKGETKTVKRILSFLFGPFFFPASLYSAELAKDVAAA